MPEFSEPRPWRRALLWLLFLGPFFFASYGFATWVTSQRADVGVLVFAWERHIPFLPWTILPYWLIDPLYGVSLFLCASRIQLDHHARRLLTAQVVAVACFLLFPLRFSFEWGHVDGYFGWLFDVLGSFDKPYNQAPSLHIALAVLLWVVYLRALPCSWRWAVHGVFALIGLSVLTTWQHHFIDLPTGLWLGLFCLWLFPDQVASPLAHAALTRDPKRRLLALIYALAAVCTGGLALTVGGTGLWLLWPAGSLALVASAYLYFGPAAFQKQGDGAMTLAARCLLAPYLIGAWLNSRAWTRTLAPADPVVPGVLLGRLPNCADLDRLGVAAIVDVSAELPCPTAGRPYVCVPLLDLVPADADRIEQAVHAIQAAYASHSDKGPVLINCALGFSRSALVVAAWLLRSGRAESPEAALALLRQARPGVVLGPALQAWWALDRRKEGGR
ncbi:MAG: serine/threonine protein phosphatase [Hydrogenophilales bacterium 28-61-23]|nr:MAG: serine/threonine protein phosphatase [Hydrogenophilales bacterium 28-61-23]